MSGKCIYQTSVEATDSEWVDAYLLLDKGDIELEITRATSCPDLFHSHIKITSKDGRDSVGYTLVEAVRLLK